MIRLKMLHALFVFLMIALACPLSVQAGPSPKMLKPAGQFIKRISKPGVVKKIPPSTGPVMVVIGVVIAGLTALMSAHGKKKEHGPRYSRVGVAVVAPSEVKRDEDLMVQVVGNLERRLDKTVLEAISVDAINHATERGRCSFWAKMKDRIVFKLAITGIEFEEDTLSVEWEERDFKLQFMAHVPKDAEVGNHFGKLLIFIDDTPVGRIGFTTRVNRFFRPSKEQAKTCEKNFKNYFISYSRKDFDVVKNCVQVMRIGDSEFSRHSFWDKMFLEPGDHYESKIYDYIDNKADAFLLFWSSNAAASDWVKKEIDRALARQRRAKPAENKMPEIIPCPIETPFPPPPEELADLQFGNAVTSLQC